MAEPKPIVLCLTGQALPLANRIAVAIGGAVHGRAGRTDTAVTFPETTAHIRDLFAAGHPVIGICAAGILIRSVAVLLADKQTEAPVIAVAEDGSAVVPLLGGHRGANRLATTIAGALGIKAAVTTASDVVHGIALDSPATGWRMEETHGTAKDVAAAILNGAEPYVAGHGALADALAHDLKAKRLDQNATLSAMLSAAQHDDAVIIATVSAQRDAVSPEVSALTYHPQQFAVGVGCARNCDTAELWCLVQEALSSGDIPETCIAGVFSLDLKADEAAMLDLADRLDRPFHVFSAEELEAESPRLKNPSAVVFQEVGCHGVAEAAALAAAGPGSELIVEKQKSANATVAIARAPKPITALGGQPRGQVALVGIGPGQAAWRTPEASRLIADADELVGYGLYIDLIGPIAAQKPRADFPLGGEEDRCRYALEQAGKGRKVALICSGDAGIYAMGALVYEVLSRPDGLSDQARRVEVVTAPGISALQAAASRAGAPLGHDFCAISLSDLLTPRGDIERRLRAAAEGDFVLALYNPVSKRRRDLFPWARNLLLGHRPADTPVVLASSLGRAEEDVRLRALCDVQTDEIDMLTTVIIGSSQSQLVTVGGRPRIFTPRGYAAKHERQAS